jgi:riboflavin-specific deaminase-like protein
MGGTNAWAENGRRAVGDASRPLVTLHFAQSLDGRIATRSGAARWISGPEATRYAHELRAAADAVLIGSGTAIADDPLLTVRHVPGKQPLRVVLDGRGRLGADANLFADTSAHTIHVTRGNAARMNASHIERWDLPPAANGAGVDLGSVLSRLGRRGVKNVLVEGGHDVITSCLRDGVVDRIVITLAPIVLGAGLDAVGDLGTERLDQAIRFTTQRTWRLGDDVMIELTRIPPAVSSSAPPRNSSPPP